MSKEVMFTDEMIEEALIKANGQPTKASELLDMNYTHLWRRVRANPKLLEVQKANRGKMLNTLVNLQSKIALHGLINEPMTDEEGNVIPNQYKDVPVDYKTRLTAIQHLTNTFKADDNVTEDINININQAKGFKLGE